MPQWRLQHRHGGRTRQVVQDRTRRAVHGAGQPDEPGTLEPDPVSHIRRRRREALGGLLPGSLRKQITSSKCRENSWHPVPGAASANRRCRPAVVLATSDCPLSVTRGRVPRSFQEWSLCVIQAVPESRLQAGGAMSPAPPIRRPSPVRACPRSLSSRAFQFTGYGIFYSRPGCAAINSRTAPVSSGSSPHAARQGRR